MPHTESHEVAEVPSIQTDVLVVGGGMAGAACAEELKNQLGKDKVLLVEARGEIGGRVYTHKQLKTPPVIEGGMTEGKRPGDFAKQAQPADYELRPSAEGGAQMVYGGFLQQFAVDHGLTVKDVSDRYAREHSYIIPVGGGLRKETDVYGDFDQSEAIDELYDEIGAFGKNISVREFLDNHSTTWKGLTPDQRQLAERMIELEYAAPLDQIGCIVFGPGIENTQNADFVGQIVGGYQQLPMAMVKDVNTKLGTSVKAIEYGPNGDIIVHAETAHNGTTNQLQIRPKSVVLAVPVPVLKSGRMSFPDSIDITKTIDDATTETVGYGKAVKVICEFKQPVWPADMKTLKSLEGPVGEAWVTSEGGHHTLTVWVASQDAEKLEGEAKEKNPLPIIKAKLGEIFGADAVNNNLSKMNLMPWGISPQAGLAYRASKPTGADFKDIKRPWTVETADPRIIMVGADLNAATVAKAVRSGLEGAKYMVEAQRRMADIEAEIRGKLTGQLTA